MRNFRQLKIWELGMDLFVLTYKLIDKLPKEEKFGLRSQICRASVSMPSNIAEGCSRSSNEEFSHFLEIALGSAFELETQIIGANRIGYFSEDDISVILSNLHEFQAKTNAYMKTLQPKLKPEQTEQ